MGLSRIAGRYELQEQLGEGGMGVVWRALDTKTGSAVAIKVMKDISDPLAVELFTKEWRTLAELSHPNIVDVRDVDIVEDNRQKKPFFVMPLLRGATLAELIANASPRLTCARVVEIMIQVCRGLQAAHQSGLVHRDMKPSNIFVMEDDTAKIIDFGVVHLAGTHSVTGQKGTFQYMSPEQAQMKELTPGSDLFSLGVILYESLTLRKPFQRPITEDTIEAVVKYMPPSVSEINPGINQSMSMVVHKCLAKHPIHRFTSARELSEALQKALRNEPVFDAARIEPRIDRAKAAFKRGDEAFASEILAELEAEGHLDPRITVLRAQIDTAVKQKKIRQLLEAARARMEQDEIPLALDKLREVFELDRQHPEALAMRDALERQRSEDQIAKWFELAERHLENRDFGSARHAAQQVMAIRRGDPRALDLLEKIGLTEAEAVRIRDQKEHLYSSALVAHQNGEIEAALGKLERLLSVAQANPSAAVPDRDAVYQSLYKEIRSERDSIHAALEDAHRHISDKKFTEAMAVCRELQGKYPNDGTFQALKIRIEDGERQEFSSYIAEVSKRVESEPDLDRRANILREASERYPGEAQFRQQLKLVRERRDLVNSIVAKAQQYDERGQYGEAISQWDILRNIYPQYPGIAIELEQSKKKRDRQVREEEQARIVEEIDRLIQNRAYAKAIASAEEALRDFPGEPEISGLRTLAEEGRERMQQSRRLFEEAQRAFGELDLERAAELLRKSLNLDPRSLGVKDMLVHVLTQRARGVVDANWQEAEPLYLEANHLEPDHPAVRALRSSISEARRQTFVGQCLADCRALVGAGDMRAAAERLRSARAEYPNDVRLEQYEAGLARELNEVRLREERGRDRTALSEERMALEQNADRASVRGVLERSYAIRAKHPDDPEIGQAVAAIELTARRVANLEDLTDLLRIETAFTGANGAGASPARALEPKAEPKWALDIGEKARRFPAPERAPKEGSAHSSKVREAARVAAGLPNRARAAAKSGMAVVAAGLVTAASLVVLAVYLPQLVDRFRHPAGDGQPRIAKPAFYPKPKLDSKANSYPITTIPADATVSIDGKVLTDRQAELGQSVLVSRRGYKPRDIHMKQASDGAILLEPEPLRLSVETGARNGTVSLDGRAISSDASLDARPLAPDNRRHTLTVPVGAGKSQDIEFEALTAERPRVTNFDASAVFVITSLGNQATIYGAAKHVYLGDKAIAVSPAGTDFTFSKQNSALKLDQGSVVLKASNAPTLSVHSLARPSLLLITANVESAKLTVDGQPVERRGEQWVFRNLTGTHNFALWADHYMLQTWKVAVKPGETISKSFQLVAIEPTQSVASLEISGGTPGAEVELDGEHVGMLDDSGALSLPNSLALGRHHSLQLSMDAYDPRVFDINPDGAEVRITSAALTPWPTVSFHVEPASATVKLRRALEAKFEAADLKGTPLQPGKYEMRVEAEGYSPWTQELDIGGDNTAISVKLVPVPGFDLEDPNSVSNENGWYKSKTPNQLVPFRAAPLPKNLVFYRQGRVLRWDKKVEWLVETPDKSAHIQYTLEGHKLTRKLVVGNKSSDQRDISDVNAESWKQKGAFSVHINPSAGGVAITNDQGNVLDLFQPKGYDFSNPRLYVRTDSLFITSKP